MVRVAISTDLIVEAMQSAATREGLRARADQIRSRAAAIAAGEDTPTQAPRVESGTRPKGRPYSRVVIDDGAGNEWGTSRKDRRRTLGRAAQ